MNNIFAALTFFTRLPFWKLRRIPNDSFKHVVPYWPLAGWLTGGVMAIVYTFFTKYLMEINISIALLFTFTCRILLTGALHEDGLADFFDGFGGGGRSRDKILSIMKDSHIGTYGVLALICYVLLWISAYKNLGNPANISCFPYTHIGLLLLAGDIWSKWCASQIINILPYARNEQEAKNKTVYQRMSKKDFFIGIMVAMMPQIPLFLLFKAQIAMFVIALVVPSITMFLLSHLMRQRIGGYTGDCCGAAFLLCELSYILTLNILWRFF